METAGKIFAYCERGQDPGFWAEPFNAVTNFFFILAGIMAVSMLARRPADESKLLRYLLVLNVILIGIGSFLFHTYATPWAAAADVIPISVFMLTFLGYALYVFAGLPIILTVPAIAGFAYVLQLAGQVDCRSLGFSHWILESTDCLNGSFGYLPALAAMLLIGAWLGIRRHPAWPYIFGAGIVFVVSVAFRSTDWLLCQNISFMDKARGTHFLWHMLNSVVLFLLLLAAIRHGGRRNQRRTPEPQHA